MDKKMFGDIQQGKFNYEVIEYLKEIMSNPKQNRVVYIYSESGKGKTFYLDILEEKLNEDYPNIRVKNINCRFLIRDYVNAIKDKTLAKFMEEYTMDTDILLVDDIDCLENKHATQELLLEFIEDYSRTKKTVVLTGKRHPRMNSFKLDFSIKSKLVVAKTAKIGTPTADDLYEYLKKLVSTVSKSFPESTLKLISKKCNGFGDVKSIVSKAMLNYSCVDSITEKQINKLLVAEYLENEAIKDSGKNQNMEMLNILFSHVSNISFKRNPNFNDFSNVSDINSFLKQIDEIKFR